MKSSLPTAHIAALVALLICWSAAAQAAEVQLVGIRLGQHAINILDVYGNPDGVVVGSGEEITTAQAPPGMGAPGGAEMMGPPGGMGMEMGGGAPPGGEMMGMPPAGGPEEMGAMPGEAMPGAPGAAAGGAGAQVAPFPRWGLPVWVTMREGEVEWIYRKGPVVMGFVLDEFGYVVVVAVAGEKCDYARTAMWRPHEYVQLGDSFKRVIYRYGWPDDTITFDSNAL